MLARYARFAVFACLLLTPLAAWAGTDESLASAYKAILRGDYDSGRQTVNHILQSDPQPEARQVRDWLEHYYSVVSSRQDLKAETFRWNTDEARRVLAEGRTYLALSFAAQAAPYASDRAAYAREPWIHELTDLCLSAAKQLEEAGKWSKALSYYTLLWRIHEDDKQLEELRDEAAQRVRIELLYKDRETLEEKVEGVNRDLLRKAVQLINRRYYELPDFKQAAHGALDNLQALAETEELHEFMDGLANPLLRRHFIKGLKRLDAELNHASDYSYRDLLRLFNEVAALNLESVEVPEGLLIIEFLEGVHIELDDYTHVIWPADLADFRKMLMGDFEGIGIQLGLDELSNRLKVVTPLDNSPALEAGVRPDDLIVAVDGKSTKGWTTQDAVENIMGPAGSEVVLTLFRPDSGQRLNVPLVRRKIILTTVHGVGRIPGQPNEWNYMLDKDAGIAYIRLTDFHPDSAHELRRALNDARRQGMEALVLDIRHNAGGVLDVALDIASNFIENREIVSTRGRDEITSRETVRGRAAFKNLPIVVMVNEGSASASEILCGALQDYDRALVLGDRTFGKGVVQNIVPLSHDAQLKVTIAHYYLPDGRTPQKMPGADEWGVDPDLALKLTPKEFRRVLEQQRDHFIIRDDPQAGAEPLSEEEQEKLLAELKSDEEGEEDEEPLLSEADIEALEADPHEAPDVDPQLETALLMLRVKLAAGAPWPRNIADAEPVPVPIR